MKLNHIALYVKDIEASAAFYEKYFRVTRNALYHNPKTDLRTYFFTFDGDADGARLELMHRPALAGDAEKSMRYGFIHICVSVGSKEEVDALTERIRADGHTVCGEPRVTGDGAYESAVLDPDGNIIEITV